MNLFKIAIRVATGHIADLTPLSELKQIAEGMLDDINDPDMQDLLKEIIESCDQGSSKAYLLMEDLNELEDELSVEGHGVPHSDY
jgi:ribosomal protein RSM22 (predicted rRNA methylase)